MLKVKIVCVGKMKEKYYAQAVAEYIKRLSKTVKVTICEVADEKAPENMSALQEENVKKIEGKRILEKISGDYVVALAIDGEQPSSTQLAQKLQQLMTGGTSSIAFVIGGSLGLSLEVLNFANYKLSFSNMTFCHQLMRVILLEQLYRAVKINAGEPYHK